MKTFNSLIILIAFLFKLNCFSQVDVQIQSLQYTNNGQSTNNSSNCGNIDLESSTSTSINFGIDLSKPNGEVVGSSKIYVYTKKTSSSPRTEEWESASIPESFWNQPSTGDDTYSTSASFTINSSDFNVAGGTLYVIFKSSADIEYSSCSYTIEKDEVPTFTISPSTTSISCGSTSAQTFGVTNVYNSPGTLSYNWQVGSGWNNSSGNPVSTFTTTTNSVTLTPYQYPPSDVKVTPVLDGVNQPQLTSVVSLGGFNPVYAITGASQLCTTATYTIDNLSPGVFVQSWTVNNTNIASISNSGNQATLTALGGNGLVSVSAVVSNACGQTKTITKNNIAVGAPTSTGFGINGLYDNISTNTQSSVSVNNAVGSSSYRWELVTQNSSCPNPSPANLARFGNGSTTTYIGGANVSISWGFCTGQYIVNCYAVNTCGESWVGQKFVSVFDRNSDPCANRNANVWTTKVYPNPIKGNSFSVSRNPPGDPCNNRMSNTDVKTEVNNDVKIYDFYGNIVYENIFKQNEFTIESIHLKTGNYILKLISLDGDVSSKLLIME